MEFHFFLSANSFICILPSQAQTFFHLFGLLLLFIVKFNICLYYTHPVKNSQYFFCNHIIFYKLNNYPLYFTLFSMFFCFFLLILYRFQNRLSFD